MGGSWWVASPPPPTKKKIGQNSCWYLDKNTLVITIQTTDHICLHRWHFPGWLCFRWIHRSPQGPFCSNFKNIRDILISFWHEQILTLFALLMQYFKENPDYNNPAFNTKYGVYSEGCGLDNVMMSWGHDDYMYLVKNLQAFIKS